MNQVTRRGQSNFEDLMRELETIEHQLFETDTSLAMSLMALEAKLRDRIQRLENRALDSYSHMDFEDPDFLDFDLSIEDIKALIPKDISALDESRTYRRKRGLHTLGLATALAFLTAVGVFGLASLLQLLISWIV